MQAERNDLPDLPRIELYPDNPRKPHTVRVSAHIKGGLAVHDDIDRPNHYAVSHVESKTTHIGAIPDRRLAFYIQAKLLEFGDWERLKDWSVQQWWQARDLQASLCQLLSCRAVAINKANNTTQAESTQFLYSLAAIAVERLAELKRQSPAACWQELVEAVNALDEEVSDAG